MAFLPVLYKYLRFFLYINYGTRGALKACKAHKARKVALISNCSYVYCNKRVFVEENSRREGI